MRTKIALFGGTFDPFTVAHEAIVKELYSRKLVDMVYVIPSITNWYRDANDKWLDDNQRLEICAAAVNKITRENQISFTQIWDNESFKKSNVPEGHLRDEYVKNRHFIDTLLDFRAYNNAAYNDDEYYLVIGADQLAFFKQWHRWQDILEMVKLIVVNGRNGKYVESDIPHIDITIDAKYNDVSATAIRNAYKNMTNGFKIYKKQFEEKQQEELLTKTPIFDLVIKPAPYDDKPNFRPIGINSKDWATIVVEKDGKFLCVKQLRYGLMKEFIEFPCGMVEDNEQPLYAAKRELEEETGIRLLKGVNDIEYLGKFSPNPAFMNNYMHYFYVNLDNVEFVQNDKKLDENERIETLWKDKKAFYDEFVESHGSVMMGLALTLIEKNNKN